MWRHFFTPLILLLTQTVAFAQEQDYNEDRIAPSRVPALFLKAAQKEAPGLRFSSVYKDSEKGYRFIARPARGKTTAIKLDRAGKFVWKRVYTDVAAAKILTLVSAALQNEIKTNKDLEAFQVTRSSLVDRFDAAKGEASTYYEFFGKTPPPHFPRVEISSDGKVVLVDRSFLPSPSDYTQRETVSGNAVPPEVRHAISEAVQGFKVGTVL
jgi:hypothetical protein